MQLGKADLDGNADVMDREPKPEQERRAKTKMFMTVPNAAAQAGFSLRHFRRLITDDHIPVVQIGRKFFILGRDFDSWEIKREAKRHAS